MSLTQLAAPQRIIFPSVSHHNASVIFREWKHCGFMTHGNGPHDGRKASTAALQMGPVLLAAVGLYEDN